MEDFGLLCLELYRLQTGINDEVCVKDLKINVLNFLNSKPPDPGMDAELTSSKALGSKKLGSLLNRFVDSV